MTEPCPFRTRRLSLQRSHRTKALVDPGPTETTTTMTTEPPRFSLDDLRIRPFAQPIPEQPVVDRERERHESWAIGAPPVVNEQDSWPGGFLPPTDGKKRVRRFIITVEEVE